MKAIVMAAGTGSRLGDITRNQCKAMVSVYGKKLIDYLLDFLSVGNFDEIIVVGGYDYASLQEHIASRNLTGVRTIFNDQYLKGNIITLMTGLTQLSNDSFLITNVDHIYPPVMFKKMMQSFYFISAMVDFDRALSHDDMKVRLRSGSRSIEAISKQLTVFDCGYIGMTYVDKAAEALYRTGVTTALEQYGERAVAENVLQVLANEEKTAPLICDLSGFGWYEVDTEEDLVKAENRLISDQNFS